MAQLDNPKSITLLFAGAFLISLAVIAFLNVEIESRSSHGSEIRNENVLELIGRKLTGAITSLRKRNAYRRSILYSILVSGNGTRSAGRRLLYFAEKPVESVEVGHSHNRSYHRLRHERKNRRLTELQTRQQKENGTAIVAPPSANPKTKGRKRKSSLEYDDNISVYLKNMNNHTFKWVQWREAGNRSMSKPETGSSPEVLKEKFVVHENCYTMNDVLEIIAITCLVNFIFWFMIITCVNMFTRNQKISKSDSCESLASIGTCSDYEIDRIQGQKKRCGGGGGEACPTSPAKSTYCRHSFVQDYVNSLMIDSGGSGIDQIPVDPASDSIYRKFQSVKTKSGGEAESTTTTTTLTTLTTALPTTAAAAASAASSREKRRRTQLISFPNVFSDMISLDNVKSFGGRRKAKENFREKRQKTNLSNSHSMENLIF